MNFKEYITEREEKEFNQLNEDLLQLAVDVLVLGSVAALAAWGGSLLFVKGTGLISRIVVNFKKGIGFLKGLGKEEVKKAVVEIRKDPLVKRQRDKTDSLEDKYGDELFHVIVALEKKDFSTAREEFKSLSKNLRNNPDIKKVIITKVTRVMKEPPLYITSPGNKTYQIIKKIIDIRTARAAAEATRLAIDKKIQEE